MAQEIMRETFSLTWQTEDEVKSLVDSLVELLRLVLLGKVEIKTVKSNKKSVLVEYYFLE